MRILFTFVGGRGHLEPLLPIARAAAAAGHTVAVSGQAALVPAIEERGFTAYATVTSSQSQPVVRTPLLAVDEEREDRVLRDAFAGSLARERARGILRLCATWSPDLIVCDELDFGAMVAAERLGLPHATVLVTAGSFVRPEVVAESLDRLRAEHGLAPDPELAMLARQLVLSPFAPSFRDPAAPLSQTAHAFKPSTLDAGSGAAPTWSKRLGDAPVVYFTLGTVFNLECGDLFARVLAGLRELAVEVVVTTGTQLDPGELGPQPATVHVERHTDHSLLLPHCHAVVSHAGSGTVRDALAHGLPLVLLPMGADQPRNARRCAALGVGEVLDATRATPGDVRTGVDAVLTRPAYDDAARRIRDEIARLPGPEHAVGLLEQLGQSVPSHTR